MFNPIFVLILLPSWLVAMVLLRVMKKHQEETEKAAAKIVTGRGKR